jgi:hypothetical protein
MGFDLVFTQKEMNKDYLAQLEGISKQLNEYQFDENFTATFNTQYFNTLTSYELRKKYFELFVCKVLRPEPLYVYRERDSICSDSDKSTAGLLDCTLVESRVKDAFRHLKTDKNNEGESFIQKWIEDPDIKCFNKFAFQPYNGIARPQEGQVFNLFTGYNTQILTPYEREKQEHILKPFHDLALQLCKGNPVYYNYFINYLAQMK